MRMEGLDSRTGDTKSLLIMLTTGSYSCFSSWWGLVSSTKDGEGKQGQCTTSSPGARMPSPAAPHSHPQSSPVSTMLVCPVTGSGDTELWCGLVILVVHVLIEPVHCNVVVDPCALG